MFMLNLRYLIKQKVHYVLLLIAVLISGWLLLETGVNSTDKTTPSSPHHLTAFAKEVTALRFDENGKLVSELYVAKLKHFSDDSSELEQPILKIYSDDHEPWEIKADQGHATEGIRVIELWDNVRLHQNHNGNHQEITIITTRAKVFPEQNYAETDQPVDFVQPGVTIKSIGVKAHFKQGQVELLSNAQGQYEPNSKP